MIREEKDFYQDYERVVKELGNSDKRAVKEQLNISERVIKLL